MMEKISPSSSWNYKPLPKQIRRITILEAQLGLPERVEYPRNRREARNLIYQLRIQLREKDNESV